VVAPQLPFPLASGSEHAPLPSELGLVLLSLLSSSVTDAEVGAEGAVGDGVSTPYALPPLLPTARWRAAWQTEPVMDVAVCGMRTRRVGRWVRRALRHACWGDQTSSLRLAAAVARVAHDHDFEYLRGCVRAVSACLSGTAEEDRLERERLDVCLRSLLKAASGHADCKVFMGVLADGVAMLGQRSRKVADWLAEHKAEWQWLVRTVADYANSSAWYRYGVVQRSRDFKTEQGKTARRRAVDRFRRANGNGRADNGGGSGAASGAGAGGTGRPAGDSLPPPPREAAWEVQRTIRYEMQNVFRQLAAGRAPVVEEPYDSDDDPEALVDMIVERKDLERRSVPIRTNCLQYDDTSEHHLLMSASGRSLWFDLTEFSVRACRE